MIRRKRKLFKASGDHSNVDWEGEWKSNLNALLTRSKEQLRPEYYRFLMKIYYDMLSDENVQSTTSIYTVLYRALLFLSWLQERGVKPEDINVDVAHEYLAWRKANGISYLSGDVRALRRIGKVLKKYDEFREIKYGKKRARIIQPDELVTREEVEKLINAFDKLLYKAQLAVMYECGLRIKEVRFLKLKDVKTEEWGFRIFIRREYTKTFEGERVVAIVEYASLLAEWLNHHPAKDNPEAFLFPSPRDPFAPQARNTFLLALKRAAKKAGVKKNVYNHLLRHSAATRIYTLLGKMRPKEFLKFFGWRDMSMLNVYEHLAFNRADEAYVAAVLNKKREEKVEEYEPQIFKCPKCGAINNINNIFCYRCGSKLKEAYVERVSETAELSELHQLINELKELMRNKEALKLLHKLSKIKVE